MRSSTDGFTSFTSIGTVNVPDNDSWRTQTYSGLTLTVADLTTRCFRIYGYNSEHNNGTWRFHNVIISGTGPLPIELIDFSYEMQSDQILVQWTTASESNNELFSVEKSFNGISFLHNGAIIGLRFSQDENRYSFIDPSPEQGYNYCRLKQVDVDGTLSYSSIITANNKYSSEHILHPTLTSDKLTLQLGKSTGTKLDIQIINRLGSLLGQFTTPEDETSYVLDVAHLESGNYFLRVNNGQSVELLPFVKL